MLRIKADKVFDGFTFKENVVLLADEDGTIRDIINDTDNSADVQLFNGIICPGFINCHCHLELSHMKGLIPQQTGLVQFVTDVVQQRQFPEEEILNAINNAEDEMIQNGIVAVGDICNNSLTIPRKLMRRIRYHNFIEASGFNPTIAAARFERSVGFYREYVRINSSNGSSASIVPHAPYSVADELWYMIINFPENYLLTIHNQETPEENEWFVQKAGALSALYENLNIDTGFFTASGTSSIQSYLPRFLKNQKVILVHNVDTTENDVVFSKSSAVSAKITWCFCVNANRYITGKLPDLPMFKRQGVDMVIGTDSLASNTQLSIASEIKTILENFPGIELEDVLKWATSNGAKALNFDDSLGSFEKGKKPGILLIDESMDHVSRIL